MSRPARARLARAERQHLAALVDADRLLDLGRQHLEQTTGAGADVEQAPGTDRQVMGKCALDLAVGNVQGPEFVPALGVVAEEAYGGRLAALLQGIESRAVGCKPGVPRVQPAHEFADEGGIVPARDQPEASELRLAEALEQAAFDQQLEMARHPRLALSQHMNIVADRQIFPRCQREDPQTRVLGRRSQKGQQMIHAKGYNYIFMFTIPIFRNR